MLFNNFEMSAFGIIAAVLRSSAAYFFDFLFSKFVVAFEFGKKLIVVSFFIKTESGNPVGFAVFKFIGIKRDIISCVRLGFGVDSVAVICVEIYFVTF